MKLGQCKTTLLEVLGILFVKRQRGFVLLHQLLNGDIEFKHSQDLFVNLYGGTHTGSPKLQQWHCQVLYLASPPFQLGPTFLSHEKAELGHAPVSLLDAMTLVAFQNRIPASLQVLQWALWQDVVGEQVKAAAIKNLIHTQKLGVHEVICSVDCCQARDMFKELAFGAAFTFQPPEAGFQVAWLENMFCAREMLPKVYVAQRECYLDCAVKKENFTTINVCSNQGAFLVSTARTATQHPDHNASRT